MGKKQSKLRKQMFFESTTFKKLSDEWETKLKASGFQDSETDYDRQHGTGKKDNFEIDPIRVVYYNKCEAWLALGKIEDPVDLFIFEKHCDGVSNRDITKLLNTDIFSIGERTVDRRLIKVLSEANITPIKFYK